MLDKYKRKINYLRISVTDRCNIRCRYCMPEQGINLLKHKDILSYDEIIAVIKESVILGIDKIRITGGEPLVRKGIVNLICEISNIPGIKDLAMTTNGILLTKFANDLAQAGLHRINVSLDTIDPLKYSYISRGGNIEDVFKGIEAARVAGLSPIKINCVIEKSAEEIDAVNVKEYCIKNGLEVRFIKSMNLSSGKFSTVIGGTGGNCKFCNRLRLTSNGLIKPCLFNESGYSIRELGITKAIYKALEKKPHHGTINNTGEFYNIGG